jgi:hypothetical protein
MARYLVYESRPRYGYGAVDVYDKNDPERHGGILRTVFSGSWLTQKASRWIAEELNAAYEAGRRDGAAEVEAEQDWKVRGLE